MRKSVVAGSLVFLLSLGGLAFGFYMLDSIPTEESAFLSYSTNGTAGINGTRSFSIPVDAGHPYTIKIRTNDFARVDYDGMVNVYVTRANFTLRMGEDVTNIIIKRESEIYYWYDRVDVFTPSVSGNLEVSVALNSSTRWYFMVYKDLEPWEAQRSLGFYWFAMTLLLPMLYFGIFHSTLKMRPWVEKGVELPPVKLSDHPTKKTWKKFPKYLGLDLDLAKQDRKELKHATKERKTRINLGFLACVGMVAVTFLLPIHLDVASIWWKLLFGACWILMVGWWVVTGKVVLQSEKQYLSKKTPELLGAILPYFEKLQNEFGFKLTDGYQFWRIEEFRPDSAAPGWKKHLKFFVNLIWSNEEATHRAAVMSGYLYLSMFLPVFVGYFIVRFLGLLFVEGLIFIGYLIFVYVAANHYLWIHRVRFLRAISTSPESVSASEKMQYLDFPVPDDYPYSLEDLKKDFHEYKDHPNLAQAIQLIYERLKQMLSDPGDQNFLTVGRGRKEPAFLQFAKGTEHDLWWEAASGAYGGNPIKSPSQSAQLVRIGFEFSRTDNFHQARDIHSDEDLKEIAWITVAVFTCIYKNDPNLPFDYGLQLGDKFLEF